jgi:hypothetical protein
VRNLGLVEERAGLDAEEGGARVEHEHKGLLQILKSQCPSTLHILKSQCPGTFTIEKLL